MYLRRLAALALIFVSYTTSEEDENVKEEASELISEAGGALNDISKACDINDRNCVQSHKKFDDIIKLLEIIQRLNKETDVIKEIGDSTAQTTENAISKVEGNKKKDGPKKKESKDKGNSKLDIKKGNTKNNGTNTPAKSKTETGTQKPDQPTRDNKKNDGSGKTKTSQENHQLVNQQNNKADQFRDNYFKHFYFFYYYF